MHEVTPNEVTTAVSIVITMFRILLQSSFCSWFGMGLEWVNTAHQSKISKSEVSNCLGKVHFNPLLYNNIYIGCLCLSLLFDLLIY